MIYTWKCETCGFVAEIHRSVQEYLTPPTQIEANHPDDHKPKWRKIIPGAPGVPWQSLRDSGVFMDENGNYPPRSMN